MFKADWKELAIITEQLGRYPDNIGAIARYCPFGKPAVIMTLPYDGGEKIYPTTYWLSCPYLVKKVSALEDDGLVKVYTKLIQDNLAVARRLQKAHQEYAQKRYQLLSLEDRERLKALSPAMLEVIKNSGVGGIVDQKGVKCLHTHLAHYLAGFFNPIGAMVWEKIQWPEKCTCTKERMNKQE